MDKFLLKQWSASTSSTSATVAARAVEAMDAGGQEIQADTEELSRDDVADNGSSGSSHCEVSPKKKKRKFVANRPRGKEDHKFQKSWQQDRPWLQYDPAKGMWCVTCNKFRQHPSVSGAGKKKNCLAIPTKYYSYRNVKAHAEHSYHICAEGLASRLQTPVSNMVIPLPASAIPQVKVLFRTVVFMVRHGLAHRLLPPLLQLQKLNGASYDLRYTSRHVPVVLHFLAAACKDYIRRKWVDARWRSLMIDEVKVADEQWLSCTGTVNDGSHVHCMVIAIAKFEDHRRDSEAVLQALRCGLQGQGIDCWLDERLVSICVDGASVLLSGFHSAIAAQAPNAVRIYCASHRTQRVDHDVTQVPKADKTDAQAMHVRNLSRKLDKLLKDTAKFFKLSTKRWAQLRKTAHDMGFHVKHGPMRQRSRGERQRRLLRYKTLQRTRFVHWKRWASHVWLNNLSALQQYLRTASFPKSQQNKVKRLLRRSEDVTLVGGMVVYERWAARLTALSLSTQAQWSVLPTLAHSVQRAIHQLSKLHEVAEDFILKCQLELNTYNGVRVSGTQQGLESLAHWTATLKDRTLNMIRKRFDVQEGGLLWASALFDRRTWPQDLKFDIDNVRMQLNSLQQGFSACNKLRLDVNDFLAIARTINQEHPPLRSSSGRIRCADAMHAWPRASQTIKTTDLLPMLTCAMQLCTVVVSQASCERVNSVVKLVFGQRRTKLSANNLANEVIVRTSVMPIDELIHAAVQLWASATLRRTASHSERPSCADEPDSSSEFLSDDSSDVSRSDSASSCSTNKSTSSMASSVSMASQSSEVTSSDASVAPPPAKQRHLEEKVAASESKNPTFLNAYTCPWFDAALQKYPILQRYAGPLENAGFNTKETLPFITVEDMANMKLPIGVRRLVMMLQAEAAV